MTATRRNAANTVSAAHDCECGRFTVLNPDGTRTPVPCGQTTKRLFAPGHDARLKGFLIRAQVAGAKVERLGAVGATEVKDALNWADYFGFGYQVRAGVALAGTKAKAKKAPKVIVEVVVPVVFVKAKVGRWIYEGEVKGDTFTYLNAKGDKVSTTKFKLV